MYTIIKIPNINHNYNGPPGRDGPPTTVVGPKASDKANTMNPKHRKLTSGVALLRF